MPKSGRKPSSLEDSTNSCASWRLNHARNDCCGCFPLVNGLLQLRRSIQGVIQDVYKIVYRLPRPFNAFATLAPTASRLWHRWLYPFPVHLPRRLAVRQAPRRDLHHHTTTAYRPTEPCLGRDEGLRAARQPGHQEGHTFRIEKASLKLLKLHKCSPAKARSRIPVDMAPARS